jgi:4-hydroxy-tetrahydrodipicolinate reductase
MRIGLIGYGKMGKLIERLAEESGDVIEVKIDPALNTNLAALEAMKEQIDIFIDFSHKDFVKEHVALALKLDKPIVVGTTGWDTEEKAVYEKVKKEKGALFYAPNFSLGVNLFLALVKEAAKKLAPHELYDVAGIEKHHQLKVDAPSGTAVALTKAIAEKFETKIDPLFSSVRVGHIYGQHDVIFDSEEDTIILSHHAKNRDGFAKGALKAAHFLLKEWHKGKRGIFTIEDLLGDL